MVVQLGVSSAQVVTDSAWNLYCKLQQKFGDERAWEFVLNFYQGAGKG